jgi:hypothetical protein
MESEYLRNSAKWEIRGSRVIDILICLIVVAVLAVSIIYVDRYADGTPHRATTHLPDGYLEATPAFRSKFHKAQQMVNELNGEVPLGCQYDTTLDAFAPIKGFVAPDARVAVCKAPPTSPPTPPVNAGPPQIGPPHP